MTLNRVNLGAGGGGGSRIRNETPLGAIDGVNTVYTTASKFLPGSENVLRNGTRQAEGVGFDYVRSESGGSGSGFDTITFTVPLISFEPGFESVVVDYNLA